MEQLEHAQVGLDDLATSHVLIYVYTHIANHAYIYLYTHTFKDDIYIHIIYMYIHLFMYTYTQSLAAAEHQDFSNSNMRIYIHGWSLHCAVLKSGAAGGGGFRADIRTQQGFA